MVSLFSFKRGSENCWQRLSILKYSIYLQKELVDRLLFRIFVADFLKQTNNELLPS